MSTHGPQFDNFRATSGNPHGGAQHDEFHAQRGAEPHGGLEYDEHGNVRVAGNSGHGVLWEDDWRSMPSTAHARLQDAGFDEPAMLDGGRLHGGTWYDVFRGGSTQVRYVIEGQDVEGIIENVHPDHAVAVSSRGDRHELALGQITYFRRAQIENTRQPTATPGRTTGSAPARGTQAQANGGQRTTLSLKEAREQLNVAKEVDATETSLQGPSESGPSVGRRARCPKKGNTRCGASRDGRCSWCGTDVSVAAGKTGQSILDVVKALA